MVRTKPGHEGCQVGELFGLLSQSHVLDILYVLIGRGARAVRFGELQGELKLSPNTLSARLKALADAGLVERTAYNEIPPRVDYQATPKARDLARVFEALTAWAGRHTLKPAV